MKEKGVILYIGGFELPDKNAAAQRVVGIAKGLKELGYTVVFLNSLKKYDQLGINEKEYFGFKCYEYKRENRFDYLFLGKTALTMIGRIRPNAILAYNYPAVALNNIRKFGKNHNIKCYADVTEWYDAVGENFIFRVIKGFDTSLRMRKVQKRLDGLIVISRYLYNYYKDSVNTVLIPPTVDISDEKWSRTTKNKKRNGTTLVYAGSPSSQKEKLDLIVKAVEKIKDNCKIKLNIVGISKEQFVKMYSWRDTFSDCICFWGRVEHNEVLQIVKQSNWAIVLRDNNRVVRAGFPTKVVESISCGTPVVANIFSNIDEYLSENNSVLIDDIERLPEYIAQLCEENRKVDRFIFDFHCYLKELDELFNAVEL